MKLIHPTGPEALACLRAMREFATALGIASPALRMLRLLIQRNMLLFRLDFLRRGITPEGELLLGGFMSGFKRTNPFYVILLTALLWGAGINVTPLTQPH
jgi:hypothetical protein